MPARSAQPRLVVMRRVTSENVFVHFSSDASSSGVSNDPLDWLGYAR